MNFPKIVLFSAIALTTVLASSGQTLLSWDVSGVDLDDATGSYAVAPHTFAGTVGISGISGGALTVSSSTSSSTTSSQYGFKVSGGDGGASATLGSAITSGNFIQFTLTASEGYVFTVSSINMNGMSTTTGANNIALLADVNGFTDTKVIAQKLGIKGVTGGWDTDSDPEGFGGPITLSGSQYQSITSITFRIYGWDISAGTGVTYLRNLTGNDLSISGSVSALSPIPEPASFGLLAGLGVIGLASTRRRRRTA